nr:MAG TPA: hypothetical protein [Caudoviricetes sp.]DAH95949.1 MAG TPA: hypothetical protein [Caudoviricetes sp.]
MVSSSTHRTGPKRPMSKKVKKLVDRLKSRVHNSLHGERQRRTGPDRGTQGRRGANRKKLDESE